MNLLASLRYLVALHEHRHFGRAAQACHITQPALSNALRSLEEEFGVVIVQRGRAYVGLTHEGQAVLTTAQRMLRDDYAASMFRLGFSNEVADILMRLSPAQLVKLASSSSLLCRFRFDDYSLLSALTHDVLGGALQQAHATILLAKQPVEELA